MRGRNGRRRLDAIEAQDLGRLGRSGFGRLRFGSLLFSKLRFSGRKNREFYCLDIVLRKGLRRSQKCNRFRSLRDRRGFGIGGSRLSHQWGLGRLNRLRLGFTGRLGFPNRFSFATRLGLSFANGLGFPNGLGLANWLRFPNRLGLANRLGLNFTSALRLNGADRFGQSEQRV